MFYFIAIEASKQILIVFTQASGNIGEVIVPALLAAGLDVTAVTREGSNTTFPSGVKVVTANYTSVASLTSILQNIDAAVSLLGPQGVQHHHRMIDAAVAAGVKYFIPSEFGFDWMDPGVFPLLPLFARKHSAIEYLKTKEKNGLSWTMIITGLWFDWASSSLCTLKATLLTNSS